MQDAEREEWLAAIATDWRRADLGDVDRELCVFAEKLTLQPSEMTREDVEALRRQGLSDEAIHLAIQVVSYFNYINRVADATHVPMETWMTPYAEGVDAG